MIGMNGMDAVLKSTDFPRAKRNRLPLSNREEPMDTLIDIKLSPDRVKSGRAETDRYWDVSFES